MNDFVAHVPVKSPLGPGSNTGQKSGDVPGQLEHGGIVDFLTVVFSEARLIERGLTRVSLLLPGIFGLQPSDVRVGELHAKRWQFYRASAVIVDSEGELIGRIGMEGNGDTVCISLTGQACKYIRNWHMVRHQIEALHGRISRCDVAYDDYDGKLGTVRHHETQAKLKAFAGGGRPPSTKFLDDHGNGGGSTLYVGSKGHKQLCIYEKGMQLGVAESPWVRYEARLYGKHCEVPTSVLTSPLDYLRGSYEYMANLLANVGNGIACAVEYTKRHVEASGAAMVKWAKRQIGPTLYVLQQAFGERFEEFLRESVLREGMPSRFKRVCKASQVPEFIRETMSPERGNLCLS